MGLDKAKNVAGRYYNPEKKQANDEVDIGLKETHEQIIDYYMEGTIDKLIAKEKGVDMPQKNR